MYASAQNPQFHSWLRVDAKVLTMAHEAPCVLIPQCFFLSSPAITPWSSCHTPRRLPLQGLCSSSFFFLNFFSLDSWISHSITHITLLRRAPIVNNAPPPPSLMICHSLYRFTVCVVSLESQFLEDRDFLLLMAMVSVPTKVLET